MSIRISPLIHKANLARQRIHVGAVQKAGKASVGVAGSLVELGANVGLALITKSPWAAAAAIGGAAVLAHKIFN